MKKNLFLIAACASLTLAHAQLQDEKDYILVKNHKGAEIGYSPSSGVKILTVDGLSFKDLNKNGALDIYEDWRRPVEERARDLARKMTTEQIAGLMLYSAHQSIPAQESGFGSGTYNNLPFSLSNAKPWELSDAQKQFLRDDNVRHVLVTSVQSPEAAARWNNAMQAFLEGIGLGIPGNTSSDPRHSGQVSSAVSAEFNAGAGGEISVWPDGLAMGATFDPEIVKRFGEIASEEYRALGITTALSPQIDLGTEPRWYRIAMTFGESPELSTDMARAYIDGFQTSKGSAEIKDGWGYHSVNAMVKHWPGGGTGEAGRDAHWAFGKFGVFPGNNFNMHLKPFLEGAFDLEGPTKKASAVMPYYTISYNQAKDGTNYANGFSKYMLTDLLRNKYGYDGVICTDWLITPDEGANPGEFAGKPWGVEKMSVAERHYIALMAGVDQFGGNNEMGPVIEAYNMGVKEHGIDYMKKRFEDSAVRLLKNIFRLGLFENPYLDPQESVKTVGKSQFMKEGFDAQVKSIVMLKNKNNVLPAKRMQTVFIPKATIPAIRDWWGNTTQESVQYPVDLDIIRRYYNVTDNPSIADFALVFVSSPHANADGGGYDFADRQKGGNGYVPISLQYGSYTAVDARTHSIAAGDPVVDPAVKDRSYKGKTTRVLNSSDLNTILNTKTAMQNRPVIVVVNAARPMIFSEFEDKADAILVRFGVGEQAVMEIVSGRQEPSGLLPVQMPADMSTVEKQQEDVPFDMRPYRDSQGNLYDFGYGLNWKGIIKDKRTEKYVKK